MQFTQKVTWRNSRRIQPWHDVCDADKLAGLVRSMRDGGWKGPPVVVITERNHNPIAITGTHRIEAARRTRVRVPTVDLDELLHAHGTSLAEVDARTGGDPTDRQHYEAVVRLPYFLPAEVVEHFGLDAH